MSDEYLDESPDEPNSQYGVYERWRPAIAAFAILATVVGIGVSVKGNNRDPGATSPNVVVQTSNAPLITVPLTRTLKPGMKGEDVLRVQQRLAVLHFDPGPQDGEFGQNTVQAVWAFEKLVMGTPRAAATGEVTPSTWAIMQSDIQVKPRRDADTQTHVEIYLPEQVLIVFKQGVPLVITHISTGSNEKWCEEVAISPGEDGNNTAVEIKRGICGEAITPPGIFYFYNRRLGMRESKLGTMYNPVYFNYNIAIHGAILVPLKPASHGCVRIPMSVARYFQAIVAYGDRVYVFDGIQEPEKYGSPVPPFDKPDPDYTTVPTTIPQTTLPNVTTTVKGSTSTTTP
ncbi:MAG: murein L,D-transpeptidase [Actinobacteria bacterium]|nr:MAG: murein L,D-transpeptidase [Actinomycetota bacterium]